MKLLLRLSILPDKNNKIMPLLPKKNSRKAVGNKSCPFQTLRKYVRIEKPTCNEMFYN